jgi:Phosphatidylethanolamine-binding protein
VRLCSEAFGDGEEIPVEFTRDGRNVSPPLSWADLPAGTREVAVIFEGVTPATHEPWVHWLAYKIPAEWDGLPAGFKHQHEPEEPRHLYHGKNSMDGDGYQGPQGTLGRSSGIGSACWRSTPRSRNRQAWTEGSSSRRLPSTSSGRQSFMQPIRGGDEPAVPGVA